MTHSSSGLYYHLNFEYEDDFSNSDVRRFQCFLISLLEREVSNENFFYSKEDKKINIYIGEYLYQISMESYLNIKNMSPVMRKIKKVTNIMEGIRYTNSLLIASS